MATSPLPQPADETLSFPEAMQAVIKGYIVTKQEWADAHTYVMLRDHLLMIRLADGWHTWTINEGDMVGTDWIIP